MEVDWSELRSAAVAAMGRAYAPYSRFPVGAAGLVEDGRVVTGCNVENASYGVGLCAECGMISALCSSGGGRLVAVSCVDGSGVPLMPCGRCRQLLWEHGGPGCLVDAVNGPLTMSALLPYAFDATDLAGPAPETRGHAVPARLAQYVGRGSVFVHADVAADGQVWTGYWERSTGTGEEPAGILEEAPNWQLPVDAVRWGRARTPRVVVVEPDGSLRWAGVGDPPTGIADRWSDVPADTDE